MLATVGAGVLAYILYRHHVQSSRIIPISVNYHFTRKCNAACSFCFHTELTSFISSTANSKLVLKMLANEGMKKLNFAGGEPFLYPRQLAELCQYAKQELKLESVSIVSNGTRIRENWLRENGANIDILAVSCDSFFAETNKKIGRAERSTGKPFDNVEKLFRIRDWCRELGIKFKLNTVVCSLNWEEDMRDVVRRLDPFRWKVFQVLIVDGENEDASRIRDARKMCVTDEQFKFFCEKHKDMKGFTPEGNDVMRNSYLILDEHLRFLDPGNGRRNNSDPILEVGVQKALSQVNWDQEGFRARGGLYDWSRGNEETHSFGGAMEGIDPKDLEY
ncbi:radical SAM enzyme [Corynespora cassiicola Philippines]|uniref:Radical SAM enzyme n=1 Tax=Corynespora cassiicola Philippines TaxID=1448308 RepID=A0A2T2NU87_CORCC|nr:radical SAM enzyme [Corynespora cassiicola Philippines]